MTAAPIHETVVRLGEQRGHPRYFVNARYLAKAGFAHGQWLAIQIVPGTITLRPSDAPTGKRVQEKNGHPLIDLNAKFLKEVFGDKHTLHVRVTETEIVLTIHSLSTKKDQRPRDGSMGSVFSGAGLLDQAGVQAGFTPKWAVEIDRATADVFATNHPASSIYEMSAHEAAFSELESVELLILGLPCQPWSRARTLEADGSKRDRTRPATEHPLGDMAFWAFLIVARVNPRTVVLECAPAFENGELWGSLCGALRRIGYDVASRVVNAHDYGALTKRKRTVLIATTPEDDGSTVNPWPETLADSVDRPTAATILDRDIPDELWWDRTTKAWIFAINERNAAKGSGFGFQIVTPDSVSMGTLTAEYGETKNDQPVVAHPTKPDTYRFFTLAEGRRIFGLPLTYKLPEAKTSAWRLLGQAVYIPLFQEIISRATRRIANAVQTAEVPVEAWSDCPLFTGIA
jgi:site-specific DNA-cytosine methylase